MPNIETKSSDDGSVIELIITDPPQSPFSVKFRTEDIGTVATELLSRATECAGKNPKYQAPRPQEGEIRCAQSNGVLASDYVESDGVAILTFVFGEALLNIALQKDGLCEIGSSLWLMMGSEQKPQ